MVKILTFYIIMAWIFTMPLKGLLILVLKLHDLSWIIYDIYGIKNKKKLEIKKQPLATRLEQ